MVDRDDYCPIEQIIGLEAWCKSLRATANVRAHASSSARGKTTDEQRQHKAWLAGDERFRYRMWRGGRYVYGPEVKA